MKEFSGKVFIRFIAGLILCTSLVSSNLLVADAAITAGVSNVSLASALEAEEEVEETVGELGNPVAGIILHLAETYLESAVEEEVEEVIISENTAETVMADFSDYGASIVSASSCINIRSGPGTDYSKIGKLYADSIVVILGSEETDDGVWYHITSGSCDGYVKSDYIETEDTERIASLITWVAVVTTDKLNVRAEMSTDSDIIAKASKGVKLTIIEDEVDGWVKVNTSVGEGYVSAAYVECQYSYTTAESKAEEKARLAAEAAAASYSSKTSSSSSSSKKTYSAPSGSDGQAVADYAVQFVGNPYKWGGTSLTNGADCSGFVMSVYAAFGVSLPHSSYKLRSVGTAVSVSDMQPGDIVCYSGHVAIYIGNNTIVHAASKSSGIKLTTPVDYKKIITVRRIFT